MSSIYDNLERKSIYEHEQQPTLSKTQKNNVRYAINPNIKKWEDELKTNKSTYEKEASKYNFSKLRVGKYNTPTNSLFAPTKTVEKSEFMENYEKTKEAYDTYNVKVDDYGKVELNDFQIKDLASVVKSGSTDITKEEIYERNYSDKTMDKLNNEMDYKASQNAKQIIADIKNNKLMTKDNNVAWDAVEGELKQYDLSENNYWRTQIEEEAKQHQIDSVSKADKQIANVISSADATIGGTYRGYVNSKIAKEVGLLISLNKYEEANDYIKKNPMKQSLQAKAGVKTSGLYNAVEGAANLAGQMGAQTDNPITAVAVTGGALLGSLAGPGGTATGMKTGLTIANAAGSYSIEAGYAYIEMIDAGVEAETAKNIAMGVGVVNGALEFVQFKKILKLFEKSNLDKTVKETMVDYVINVVENSIQEVAQEGSTIAGVNLGKSQSGLETDDFKTVSQRLIDTGVSSLITFALFNSPGMAMNVTDTVGNKKVNKNKKGQLILSRNKINKFIAQTKDLIDKSKTKAELDVTTITLDKAMSVIEMTPDERKKIGQFIIDKEKTIKKSEVVADKKTKIADKTNEIEVIDAKINDAIVRLTSESAVGSVDINAIYTEMEELKKQRTKLNEELSENNKVKKISKLKKEIDTTNEIPVEKQNYSDVQKIKDKAEQVENMTTTVEKEKDIKVLSNKQYVKENEKVLMTNAQTIIDKLNIVIQDSDKPIQIVTELNQEQHQIQDLGAVFGKKVVFVNNMNSSGITLPANDKLIFIDTNAKNSLITAKGEDAMMLYVTGHELFHSLKQSYPAIYNQFIDYVKTEITSKQIVDFMKKYDKNDSQQLLANLKIDGKFDLKAIKANPTKYAQQNETLNKISEEMMSHEFGRMMTDKVYLTKLKQTNPNLFKQVVDAIRKLFKSIEGSVFDSELTQLQVETIRDTFEETIGELETELQKDSSEKIKQSQETFKKENKKVKVKPKVDIVKKKLYHGTDKTFDSFDNGFATAEKFRFTDDKTLAQKYGNFLKTVNLNIKNPYIIDYENKSWFDNDFKDERWDIDGLIEKLTKEGKYDGLQINNIIDSPTVETIKDFKPATQYIPFNENQILKTQKKVEVKPVIEETFVDKTSTITKQDLDTRYGYINKTMKRYEDEKNITTKKTLLDSAARAYNNYKKDGGTNINEEIAAQKKKMQFNKKMSDKLGMKQLPKTETVQQKKESKFFKNTITNSDLFTDMEKIGNENPKLKYYMTELKKHDTDMDKAVQNIREKGIEAQEEFFDKDRLNSVDTATAKLLVKYYQGKNNTNAEVRILTKLRKEFTTSGQMVESAKIFKDFTPASIVISIQNDLDRAFDEASATHDPTIRAWVNENIGRVNLTEAEKEWVYQMAKKANAMDSDSSEYKRTFALINSFVADRVPKSIAKKLKTFRRISMLFNGKTMGRNILGNVGMLLPHLGADTIGTGLDKQLAKMTNVRTQGTVKFKELGKGAKKGAVDSIADRSLWINTSRTNPFEMQQGKTFNNNKLIGKGLNEVERDMNFLLNFGDRPFEEAYYQNSLTNQMRLNNVTEATETMKQIAQQEAEKKTWKNNGKLLKAASKARETMNIIGVKDLGLGDLVIPFIMTPANLIVATYDFSPAAIITVANNARKFTKAVKSGGDASLAQKALVDSYGKAVTGTLIYALAYVLAKAGITSGGEDEDKDVKAMMRAQGYLPYAIKIDDKSFTYDWAQPISNAFATMAELQRQADVNKNNPNKGDDASNAFKVISEAFTIGGDRLYEQSFLQSLKTLLSAQSPKEGIIDFAASLPASFVPTLSKQIADTLDNDIKASYDSNNLLSTMLSSTIARIPFAKSMLPTKKNVLGQDIEFNAGENNPFATFFSPSIISRDTSGDVGNEIFDVYNHTGENAMIPQVAIRYMDYDINNDGFKDRITFDTTQQSKLQDIMGTLVYDTMTDLSINDVYNNASYDDKAIALTSLMQYAKAKAIEQSGFVPNYEIKAGNASQINQYVGNGLGVPEAIMYDSMINPIKSLKDENGETITGSFNGQKAYTIMKMQISDSNKNTMLLMISPNSNTPETVDTLSKLGSQQQYIDYYALPRRDTYIIDKYSRDDYDMATKYYNLTGGQYTEYSGELSSITADVDANGETITNSRKTKITQYINTLPINKYQKMYLLNVAGYSVKAYKNDLFTYINNLNIRADEKTIMWETLGL